jgi:hypothetical protein
MTKMKIDDTFHGISTLILTNFQGKQVLGTGFFYQELAPKDPAKKGYYWREVKETWVATNRHVLLPKVKGKEVIPDNVTFHIRKIVDDGIVWEPVILDVTEFKKRLKLHTDAGVDVAILRIGDLLTERLKTGNKLMAWSAVSEENLPGNNNISAEVADDVVIIGYPKGFYDEKNVFPIVKSGIIATRWGLNFNGMPVFLIDAKLFPGSSGSIVITKPIDFVVIDGKPLYAKEKQFAFLGVYSGEPFIQKEPIDLDDMTIIRKDSFNVGIVWYSQLVVDIAKKGENLS